MSYPDFPLSHPLLPPVCLDVYHPACPVLSRGLLCSLSAYISGARTPPPSPLTVSLYASAPAVIGHNLICFSFLFFLTPISLFSYSPFFGLTLHGVCFPCNVIEVFFLFKTFSHCLRRSTVPLATSLPFVPLLCAGEENQGRRRE